GRSTDRTLRWPGVPAWVAVAGVVGRHSVEVGQLGLDDLLGGRPHTGVDVVVDDVADRGRRGRSPVECGPDLVDALQTVGPVVVDDPGWVVDAGTVGGFDDRERFVIAPAAQPLEGAQLVR